MRERRWLLLVLYGLLLASAVSGALKATRPKFKIATTSTTTSTTEEPEAAENENGELEGTTPTNDVNATTARVLTGIPQIDYIWDPNLPRELNGYNLSEYPFYSGIPEEINFKCDGLHDGFYASVPHKCQVYHHCLYGTRYDFLCANFTAFDQRTFICHFASEVDCANSKKYWHRNDALYKSAETTTLSTTTTSTSTTPSTTTTQQAPLQGPRPGGRRRRPYRRRPAYDYYEEYYDDESAYERTRPRGYDRRDEYDYDDRKYVRRDRDRDRNFRDRDYWDRELPRSRDPDRPLREPERPAKEEPPLSPRERFPSRNNRRDPVRPSAIISPRDPDLEDEPRNRNRDQDPPIRAREPDDLPHDERTRPLDSRNRDVDDRRYSDKGYADDYEEDPVASGPAAPPGSSDVLVKPAAPPSSVYARPRTPPKIRRPVPITEQEKFAYKATAAPPAAAVEPRRRPTEIPPEDDYYDEELEEVRPRRPANRRRPGFRDFYESPRDRDRDRPFRMRYREEDEEEQLRPRKHPERGRERYWPERGRDRSLDRSKDRGLDRIPESGRERQSGRLQDTGSDRPSSGRPVEREHDIERPRSSSRSKESGTDILETTRRPNIYERTSVAPSTTSTTSTEAAVKGDDSRKQQTDTRNINRPGAQNTGPRNSQDEQHRDYQTDKEPGYDSSPLDNPSGDEIPSKDVDKPKNEAEEYSSLEDDYDEPEYQPAPPPPPRTAVRIVKRPFLPSRGGNPNPRGLSPVGSKTPETLKKEDASLTRGSANKSSKGQSELYRAPESHGNVEKSHDSSDANERRNYDAYKTVKKEENQKTRSENYEEVLSRPATRRPVENPRREEDKHSTLAPAPTERTRSQSHIPRIPEKEENVNSRDSGLRNLPGRHSDTRGNSSGREKSTGTWNSQEYRPEHSQGHREPDPTPSVTNASPNRPKSRFTETPSYYDSSYTREPSNDRESQPILQSGNVATSKQTLNEVVTHDRLQEIPESEYDVTLNEALTPSFNNQETNLPSGFVLPIHRQLSREPILQSTENSYKVSRPYNQQTSLSQSQPQQQKPFVPSPQFLPLAGIGSPPVGNERSRSVQYFRTPEAVHVTGPQYRHQRGPWHDYTGY